MLSSEKSTAVYTGYKISKVRWKPLPVGAIGKSDTLITGSYEDQVNRLCMWTLAAQEGLDQLEPELSCEHEVRAAVTELVFIDEQFMVASLEDGSVIMLKQVASANVLKQVQLWDSLHRMPTGQSAPCTALAVCGEGGRVGIGAVSMVTGGEDGRITVLRTDDPQPLRIIESADSSTVTALSCSLQLEVLSTSSSGQLKVWDLRSKSDRPVSYVLVPGEYTSMESLARHPHQPHVVAVGRGDGSLCLKDLRQPKHSLQLLQAHSAEVWEVKFDSCHPNNLFTCSQDGSLWHWDVNDTTPTPYPLSSSGYTNTLHSAYASQMESSFVEDCQNGTRMGTGSVTSPWLSDAVQRGKVNIQDYSPGQGLSVNSLDVESQRLVCGTDGEALFLISHLTLR